MLDGMMDQPGMGCGKSQTAVFARKWICGLVVPRAVRLVRTEGADQAFQMSQESRELFHDGLVGDKVRTVLCDGRIPALA